MSAQIKKYLKPVLAGIIGMVSLVFIYWLILFLTTKDLYHPFQQFLEYKYWIIALVLGFGIQMGLFWYIRSGLHLSGVASKSAIATGAGTSATAMVACCAHHLVDILPILGLSAAALFLTKYQTWFFGLGIISNIIGIIIMLYIIKQKRHPQIFKYFKLKFGKK